MKKYNVLVLITFVVVFMYTLIVVAPYLYSQLEILTQSKTTYKKVNPVAKQQVYATTQNKIANSDIESNLYAVQIFSSLNMNNALGIMKLLRSRGYRCEIRSEAPYHRVLLDRQYMDKAIADQAVYAFITKFDTGFVNENIPFVKVL